MPAGGDVLACAGSAAVFLRRQGSRHNMVATAKDNVVIIIRAAARRLL
jgi:hypothetical protein